jgi:hypothetical protein
LKRPERQKTGTGFSATIRNPDLWDALEHYRTVFRPIFDNGTALFPSQLSVGAALSEKALADLIQNETALHLGVGVSIHRVRDCVGTEASEAFLDDATMGPRLLGHSLDARTFDAHYNHAQGLKAAAEFAEVLAHRQTRRPDLLL